MCWYSEKLKIKTAKKDIPVWKIVRCSDSSDKCLSLYAKFPYVKSIIETSSINFELRRYDKTIMGSTGFHSYSNKLKLERNDNGFIFVYKKEIFSNLKDYIMAVGDFNARIARFYIPRGYEYAENKHGEIISSAIVFDNFIE
ncbi:MAG: hypothetical protein UHU19_04090 [Lachnospiraceae bacterium]|nr:hypothetical protein [Lachnospiraceae bacterium]